MIAIETGVYIGIVIMGAMILAVTAFLVLKSTSQKDIAQTQKQPVENIETPAALKKRPAPALGLVLNRLKFPLGLTLREFSWQRRNASPDQQPIDEGLAINEQFSIPLPGVASSEPETNAAPSYPDQGIPNVEPANEEESEVNTLNTFPAESAESTQGWPQDEPEELTEASDNEYQEQPPTGDKVFDLFKAEIAEEGDISKLAATLNNIDVHDLLEEAQNLINRIRDGRR